MAQYDSNPFSNYPENKYGDVSGTMSTNPFGDSQSDEIVYTSNSSLHTDAAPIHTNAPGQPISSDSSAPFGENVKYSCCSLGYYQVLFDVDGDILIKRILNSFTLGAIPLLNDLQGEKADLYGPVWITTTLIFLLAVCGNLADYLANGIPKPDETDPTKMWQYDFTKVTIAATTFYLILLVLPIVWFFSLQCLNAKRPYAALVSYYGYSFTAYIPAAILCIMPYLPARIVVVSLACAFSTAFLLRNLYSSFLMPPTAETNEESAEAHKKTGLLLVLGAGVIHLGLALLTYFYFFNYSSKI